MLPWIDDNFFLTTISTIAIGFRDDTLLFVVVFLFSSLCCGQGKQISIIVLWFLSTLQTYREHSRAMLLMGEIFHDEMGTKPISH
jgi:hypothetical protein